MGAPRKEKGNLVCFDEHYIANVRNDQDILEKYVYNE